MLFERKYNHQYEYEYREKGDLSLKGPETS